MQEILVAILAWLMPTAYSAYKKRCDAKTSVSLARSEEVHNWGWDGQTLLKKLISLDKKVIGSTLTDEREGTIQQWAPIFTAHPDCWVLLVKGPRKIIVGWRGQEAWRMAPTDGGGGRAGWPESRRAGCVFPRRGHPLRY